MFSSVYLLQGHNNDRGCHNLTNIPKIYPNCKLIADDGYTRTERMLLVPSFSDKLTQQMIKDARSVVETAIGYSHTFRASVDRCKLDVDLQSKTIVYFHVGL